MKHGFLLTVGGLFLSALRAASAAPSQHFSATGPARTVSFEERVAAQRAIEDVYWRRRIWPKENPQPKPPLSAVMSDDAIRAKVEDYLRKSNALEKWWRRPLTGAQLQAELNRMAAHTRDAATLQELFAALGNDPSVIAETLARQTLADRLIRNWYAFDARIHGAVRRRAEEALARTTAVSGMKALGAEYTEATFTLRRADQNFEAPRADGAVELDAAQWRERLDDLAARFGTTADAIPLQRLTPLREERDRLSVSAPLSRMDGEIVVATTSWPKQPFDAWWQRERTTIAPDISPDATTFAIAETTTDSCTDDTWQSEFYVATARSGHTAIWTGTEMIVWGAVAGTNGGRYSPATDTWTPTSTGTGVPSARSWSTAVWTGTEMIIWGGSSYTNTGGRYNPSTDAWTATSTSANTPTGRASHTAVWTGSEMIVWGGYASAGSLNTGGRYNPVSDTWTRTSTGANTPRARSHHTAVWTGDEMIVWGGGYNTGGRYNPVADTWTATSVSSSTPEPRSGATAVWTGAEMIIWGGNTGYCLNTGARYNPSADSWTATSTGANAPEGRQFHTAVWTGAEMIVWGGSYLDADDEPVYLNTGGRYNPASDTWTATSTGANTPTERDHPSAVWTGAEMIVWGGGYLYSPDGSTWRQRVLETGGRYDPATDSWTPTSTGGDAPTGRDSLTAVWTGAEVIAWGGRAVDADPRNSGGRYDPAIDHWTPTAMGADTPEPRYAHTAVWTGEEMIVWGGSIRSGVLNSGGRYSPATDQWALTPLGPNLPSARTGHTAVWTGAEMVVWGGSGTNTGGRYAPSKEMWTPTSTDSNTPRGRTAHTAVWTGSEMIVWGGFYVDTTTNYLNTGGRYDPLTDSWLSCSLTTGAGTDTPAARAYHTAVWTGARMIVWGASGATGGLYDPATDAWTPTPTGANAPAARSMNTAVWTGAEMIVWGGATLNTGGRYNPLVDVWSATAVNASTPPPRYNHAAVWTGKQMIVLGGIPYRNDMGLYCAEVCVLPTISYRDQDGDGRGEAAVSTRTCDGSIPQGYAADGTDCDDASAAVWHVPGEVANLRFSDATTLTWEAGADPGGTALTFDTLRSGDPADFVGGASCLEAAGVDTTSIDETTPAPGSCAFYLVRGSDACGVGSIGTTSSGQEQPARACP